MNIFLTIGLFFVATLINVILSTLKRVITLKGGRVIASLTNAVAYGFNTIIIKFVAGVELYTAVSISIVANLIGVYIALTITQKFEKERLWKITVSIPTESLGEFKKQLHHLDIAFIAYETSYQKYKVVDIFSENKKQSKVIREVMANFKVKYTISANAGVL